MEIKPDALGPDGGERDDTRGVHLILYDGDDHWCEASLKAV